MAEGIEVWLADDDRSMRWVLERALDAHGMSVRAFDSADELCSALDSGAPDVVITDIRMPGTDGLALMRALHERDPELPVIVITAYSDLDSAVASYQGGAFEYLPKPFDVDEAAALVQRAHRNRRAGDHSAPERGRRETPALVGEAPAMQEVFRAIGRLSGSDVTVLITGESGTGKELVAGALHDHGPRANGPFIALNTSAIPKDLLESELFGHERGAFTGAHSQRRGRFEQAHRGTLFLDEIGDMPAELQTRLLRVLSEGRFYRVGGHESVHSDVRIIAATHQDLEGAVREGSFREDLYHRLNVIRVHVPALRERREDIPLLLHHYLARSADELGARAKALGPDAEAFLARLDWPGNVRELANTCRWLTVMASGREVGLEDLPPELRSSPSGAEAGGAGEAGPVSWQAALDAWAERELAAGGSEVAQRALPEFERVLIRAALKRSGGRRGEAARLLGWGRNTLTRKLKELDLDD